MSNIRIAGIVGQSIVDGPGLRLVVFTQGCPHRCPDCHNPETHDFAGGKDIDTESILKMVDKNILLQGVTLSGGEPFSRPTDLLLLAQEIKARGLDLWCYSGYTFGELYENSKTDEGTFALLSLIDVLVDGRYDKNLRDLTLKFHGSKNQQVVDVAKSLIEQKPVLVEGY